jgi:hypothetical protein
MLNLTQILKNWHLDRGVLTSPLIPDKKIFQHYKQMLIRAWIHAEYDDKRCIIRIPLKPEDPRGKANIEKLEKLNIFFSS